MHRHHIGSATGHPRGLGKTFRSGEKEVGRPQGLFHNRRGHCADEIDRIKERLIEFASKSIDLILTTGDGFCSPGPDSRGNASGSVDGNRSGIFGAMRRDRWRLPACDAVPGGIRNSETQSYHQSPGSPKAVGRTRNNRKGASPRFELLKGQ
jgi:hypothetical protein